MADYDRRTAAEPGDKLLELAQLAEHQFKAAVALMEQVRATLVAARAETQKLPSRERNMFQMAGPREALGDYARHLIEEIDNTKILKANHMPRWFEEFVSETKAHLKDI